MTNFSELELIDPIHQAVAAAGYHSPTPIQSEAIPHLLKGKDLLGCAQTGTGKTAAFALPILQTLHLNGGRKGRIRALVLTPTRELAAQIKDSFDVYGQNLDLLATVIFGGVKQFHQEKELARRPDILVATPGRLLDLMSQNIITLKDLEIFVLDEADRMLDMGFIHDVRKVISALPSRRQSLFFSATMPPEVARLADTLLTHPARVEVTPQATPVERIEQTVMFVDKGDKRRLLKYLLDEKDIAKVLVFTRTKHLAGRLAKQLAAKGIAADAIHGNKSQAARTRALDGFRGKELRVLVATDIAARGIDVEGVTHVINFDLPNIPESYVHRIGRTARAGADGASISFCCGDELDYLVDIEQLLGSRIPVTEDHPYNSTDAAEGMVDGVRVAKKTRRDKPGRDRSTPRRDTRPVQVRSAQDRSSGKANTSEDTRAKSGDGRPKRRRRRRRKSSGGPEGSGRSGS